MVIEGKLAKPDQRGPLQTVLVYQKAFWLWNIHTVAYHLAGCPFILQEGLSNDHPNAYQHCINELTTRVHAQHQQFDPGVWKMPEAPTFWLTSCKQHPPPFWGYPHPLSDLSKTARSTLRCVTLPCVSLQHLPGHRHYQPRFHGLLLPALSLHSMMHE